ncbi:hypothetical protein K1T71_010330 [Dendrolimus kikuchii]|uniref:Uncharacterized protein n=1 Tax=Dendrolimus kikuchii TaxID=765133 RepID=A0ACC1CR91_9NEOP|nr:hypothetical protein K1T71_010330 [Dendrolimus kikuchii]
MNLQSLRNKLNIHPTTACEDGGGGAATGNGGRAASLRLANGRVAAQSAEQLPHSPADCASVRISIDNTNTCCTDSLVTALDDETLLLEYIISPRRGREIRHQEPNYRAVNIDHECGARLDVTESARMAFPQAERSR